MGLTYVEDSLSPEPGELSLTYRDGKKTAQFLNFVQNLSLRLFKNRIDKDMPLLTTKIPIERKLNSLKKGLRH